MTISDHKLRDDVEAELDWNTAVDSRRIGVTAQGGVVTLTGHVPSYAERRVAEELTQSVQGVRAVANELTIDLPFDSKRSDTEIAQSAVQTLGANVAVPADSVKISVRDGWISLEGEVFAWYQRKAAEDALAALRGVNGIINRIAIRPQVTVQDVQRRIKEALHRRAQLDATTIRISTSDGTVTLDGQVDSWHERNQAEVAAWQAPGVSKVIDNLTIRI